jgi:hypothetical protein
MRNIIRTIIAAVSVVLAVLVASPASARVVQIEEPDRERITHNAMTYMERVTPRWTYIELADGSTWRATDCRQEDSRNCVWDAQRLGNERGHSFLNIAGHLHYLRPDVRITMTSRCRDTGAKAYAFRMRNTGHVTRTVRMWLTTRGHTIGAWYELRAGRRDVQRIIVRDVRKRVTFKSQGQVIMRATLTRGGCGR